MPVWTVVWGRNAGGERFEPLMPEVDVLPNLEEVFGKARAAGKGGRPPGGPGRKVVVVTPGRMLMFL